MTRDRSQALRETVLEVVDATPIYDIHTHLYDPHFGDLLLWGLDDLLTYHYLVAEAFRYLDIPYATYWSMPKEEQAKLIWQHLFMENSPISESCRGVLTTLQSLGFDVRKRDLPALRQHYKRWTPGDFVTRVLETANVRRVCMTNSPFDDLERPAWDRGVSRDERFNAALRIDPLLLDWPGTAPKLRAWGYDVQESLTQNTLDEVRRFLADWTRRIDSRYCMVSLPPDWTLAEIPHGSNMATCTQLLEGAVLPHGRDHGQALAIMLGVRRSANPGLLLAGDAVGQGDITQIEALCRRFPENRFLCTALARENQHELCVAARKFRNLHLFGCWWFMNNPSLIDETTRMRLEMLGLSVTPQHSDARVLDQLIYKWKHSRHIIGEVLAEKYIDLANTGWDPTREEIERDVTNLFGGAFEKFLK